MGIANVINVTGSAGGGEIIRELINSSDGQGLHFDGAAGNIDLATPPDLGTKFSFEFVIKADSTGASAKIIDFGDGGRFSIEHNTTGLQVKSAGSGWYTIQTPSMLADLDVHHMVVTVDNTALTLYDNSNEVATATIAAPDIDSCADARIGTYFDFAASECFHGSMYRCRFYNKALTQAEVDTAYQKADVPFESQYGSQTSLVDANASTFVGTSIYGWVKYGNNTIANTSNQLVITYVDNVQGAYHYLRDSTDLTTNLTVGKKYKLKIDAKYAGGSAGVKLRIADGVATTEFATLTTSLTTYEVEFTAQSATGCYINLGDMSASNVVTLDNYYVYSCGCVSDFDLAFANPTQSLMVQDRAGVADGTATAGVSQTQKIVQLNSTSAVVASSAFTPTDGHIATDCLTLPKAGGTPSLSFDYGSVYNLLDGAVTTSQETTHLAGRNIAFHVNANTANAMTISSAGLVSIGNVTATKLLHLKSADPVIRLEDSDPDGVYSEIDGAGGDLIISCDGGNGAANSDIMFKVDGSTKMNISSAGLVSITENADGALGPELRLVNDPGASTAAGTEARLTFAPHHSGGEVASIRGIAENTGAKTKLSFYTHSGSALAERVKINGDGAVTIGAFTLPTADGTNGQVLQTNGSGTVTWEDSGGGGGGGVTGSGTNTYVPRWDGTSALEDSNIVAADNGSVGFGIASPSYRIHSTSVVCCEDGAPAFRLSGTATVTKLIDLKCDGGVFKLRDVNGGAEFYNVTNTYHKWYINSNEVMQMNSSGNLLVGCTSVPDASNSGIVLTGTNSGNRSSSGAPTTAYNHWVFYNGNGIVGSISTSGSATAYNTSSDYRLKENVVPLTNALDRIDEIPVYRFNFKTEPDITVDGFLADEVAPYVPESVTGTRDGMKTVVIQEGKEQRDYVAPEFWGEDDELPEDVRIGDLKIAEVQAQEYQEEITEEQPDYQQIDQSKLVPLLIAAVKELKAKVEALENA